MNINDFGPFTLSPGSHNNPQEGMCVMEMVSFLAGEEWSDEPECASPVVSRFCRVINDNFDQHSRDRLQTYVPRLIGTASPEHDQERVEYLAWSAIQIFAPAALRQAGFDEWADKLENFEGTLGEASSVARAVKTAAAGAAAGASACYYTATASSYPASAAARAAVNIDPELVFKVLDGLLEIGPSGSTYSQEHTDRLIPLKQATKQFA